VEVPVAEEMPEHLVVEMALLVQQIPVVAVAVVAQTPRPLLEALVVMEVRE
jgi:hypothetical protein